MIPVFNTNFKDAGGGTIGSNHSFYSNINCSTFHVYTFPSMFHNEMMIFINPMSVSFVYSISEL